ncbi:hypothetical protein PIB30_037724 [Stylosanthes scabra]|uniref:PB1-like domain-containing protein n=1 Tax=Stylosanthes scabra TaxID=79078 RepID=A0ABU6RE15_9FABA|nr:hypothetical protein [Stylosanthes scabra]
MGYFSVKIHHGGRYSLVAGVVTSYVDGQESFFDWCNSYKWSLTEVYDVLLKIGYRKDIISVLWYKDEGLGFLEGRRELKDDGGAMDTASIGVENGLVKLYVLHKTEVPVDGFDSGIGFIDVGDGINAKVVGFVNVEVGSGDAGEAQQDVGEKAQDDYGVEAQDDVLVDGKVVNEDEDVDSEEDPDYDPEANYSADSDLNFNDSEDGYCGDDPRFDVDITLEELQEEVKNKKKDKPKRKKGKAGEKS